MEAKRVLVVYFSRTDVTRRVASELSAYLACDVERLRESRPRLGVAGYLRSAMEARLRQRAPILPARRDPGLYDLVIVGTPVWFSSLSSPVRSYLVEQRSRLPSVAYFLTHGGSGAARTFQQMQLACGRTPEAHLALTERQVLSGEFVPALWSWADRLVGAPAEPEAQVSSPPAEPPPPLP